MLKVLLHKNDDTVMDNDYYFGKYTVPFLFDSTARASVLKAKVEELEPVKFDCKEAGWCTSLIMGNTIRTTEMSTGIKTLLNIATHPKVPFSIKECGLNVLHNIYAIKNGIIYMDILIPDFLNPYPVKVILEDGTETEPMDMFTFARWFEHDREIDNRI